MKEMEIIPREMGTLYDLFYWRGLVLPCFKCDFVRNSRAGVAHDFTMGWAHL
jgi:hypothetical protein